MGVIFSPKFWVQTIVSTLVTMTLIYLIKRFATNYNVPVVSTVAEGI